MYGPSLIESWSRRQSGWHHLGGQNHAQNQYRDPNRKTWKEIMKECNVALVEKVVMVNVTKEEVVSSTNGSNERKPIYQEEETVGSCP